MAGRQHKSKKELKRESRELALTERRVLLCLAVVLAIAALVSQIFGLHGSFPATTGLGAGLSGLAGRLRR